MNIKTEKKDGAWDDAEINTPDHDELVLHLLKNNVAERIVSAITRKEEGTFLEINNKVSEYVVGKSFIHGYVDVVYSISRCKYYDTDRGVQRKDIINSFRIFFEVKPKVVNFGSLLRQINKYKANLDDGIWVVYTKECPDDIKQALKGQGVVVLIHHL